MEEYSEYGDIKKPIKQNATFNEHRIHLTKDLIDSNCYLCQKAIDNYQKSHVNTEQFSYWEEDI